MDIKNIKFRAFDKENNKILDWEYLNRHPNLILNPSYNFEWMQFINFVDDNKKEIYEGDIVVIPSHYGVDYYFKYFNAVVVFEEGSFGIEPIDKKISTWGDFQWSECEVIGNIYENPELLLVQNEVPKTKFIKCDFSLLFNVPEDCPDNKFIKIVNELIDDIPSNLSINMIDKKLLNFNYQNENHLCI
jgi:hypothetical protein